MKGVRGGKKLEKVKCARLGCNKKFLKKVHNQKYHDKECCQKATNQKLLKKYYDNKKPVASNRTCKTRGCKTILSTYNRDEYCEPCKRNQQLKILRRKI